MKKHILIVNGYPTCGKTTFNNIVKEFCMAEIFSSIEPINQILREMGWDGVTKDEKYRNFASILKSESTKFNDYSYHKVCEKIEEFFNTPAEKPVAEIYKPCMYPYSNMMINPQGDVYPCLSQKIGNIKDMQIKEVFNLPHYRCFRKNLHAAKVFGACQMCCELCVK